MTMEDTACLRIRFTPLLKDIVRDDSKHCVEIVPEINCIQNLDKIQWKKEENCIEYTIPMTYKIILRKKQSIKDTINEAKDLDKTYHSCVDLLLPSSDIALNRGSGDINRILSDTFVLSKVTTDVERCSIILREEENINKIDDTIELTTAQMQTEVYSNPSISSPLIYNEIIESAYRKPKEVAVKTPPEVVQSESINQFTGTGILDRNKGAINKIANIDYTKGTAVKMSETVAVFSNNNKSEAKQKLSVSPICSVNTHEENVTPAGKGFPEKIVFRLYESPNCIIKIQNEKIKRSDFVCDLFETVDQIKPQNQYDYVSSPRIKPEIRVANFKQIMEKEIMPLKLMLSDLINKCSSLGVVCRKQQKYPIFYTNVFNGNKEISSCFKTVKETKSNRVVYSIVFDG